MRLLACLIVAPQRGYDEPATLSYAISSFCPTSADGLQVDVSQQPCRRYRGGRPLCAANGRLPDSLLSCHPTPRTTVLDVVWCDIKSDRGVDLASDYRGVPMGPCA